MKPFIKNNYVQSTRWRLDKFCTILSISLGSINILSLSIGICNSVEQQKFHIVKMSVSVPQHHENL